LGSGLGFIEGPIWTEAGLAFVSLEHGCAYRLEENGTATRIAETSGGPNGLAAGRSALYVAQNGGIFAARSKAEPSVQVIGAEGIEDRFVGHFHAPNDLCFGPDGLLYVTDPASEKGIFEPIAGRVLACDLSTGESRVVIEGRYFPNGLAFDADGHHLYLTQTYSRMVEKFAVEEGSLRSLGTFCETVNGRPDGMAIDVEGNLWVCTPGTGGIEVFGPDGRHVERIEFGEGSMTTNCCFGGEDLQDLYVTSAGLGSILKLRAPCPGLALVTGP
jgi:gluconolactonase